MKIEISGTVVPHRDFHRNTSEMPLNKGSPRDFLSRPRAAAPALTHAPAISQVCTSFMKSITNYKKWNLICPKKI